MNLESQPRQRAYRYRFYPTKEQEPLLLRTFGCVRFVYNWGLASRTEQYKKFKAGEVKVRPTFKWSSAELTKLKKDPERSWLKEVSSVPLQQALRHLDRAFSRFFDPKISSAHPSFKKKRDGAGSAAFTRFGFTWHPGRRELTLAKMRAPLDIRWSREFTGDPSTVTISRDATGRWHVSILVEEEISELSPPANEGVGIDVGLTDFATLSDGEKVSNPRFLRKAERRLAKRQRALSRKQRGSANRRKARFRVARAYARVADMRRDFLHKLTTRLVRENQTICVETLNVSGMLKNRRLAKSIADASWSEFFRQLTYKASWYGRQFVAIDRFFPSSKTCHACDTVVEKLSLSERSWRCVCGVEHDRDINAAKNIRAAGLAVLAERLMPMEGA